MGRLVEPRKIVDTKVVDTGGQAFPRLGTKGMTLLDWFAANATEKDYFPYTRKETSENVFETRPIEEARYLYAQAMIKVKRRIE